MATAAPAQSASAPAAPGTPLSTSVHSGEGSDVVSPTNQALEVTADTLGPAVSPVAHPPTAQHQAMPTPDAAGVGAGFVFPGRSSPFTPIVVGGKAVHEQHQHAHHQQQPQQHHQPRRDSGNGSNFGNSLRMTPVGHDGSRRSSGQDTVPGAGGSATPPPSCNVLVSDLPTGCTHGMLREHCERFGGVLSVNVKSEPRGRSGIKGFVKFCDPATASRARASIHGSTLGGVRVSAYSANHSGGAVPSNTMFIRFIPRAVDHSTLHAFFSSFRPIRSAKVRPQKSTDNPSPSNWSFQEAVVDFVDVVPESVREAIADTTVITSQSNGQRYELPQPLVVKFDEPERERVARNTEVGSRRGSNASQQQRSGAGTPVGPPVIPAVTLPPPMQTAPDQPPIVIPLAVWVQQTSSNGVVTLPPGATLVNVNGSPCIQIPRHLVMPVAPGQPGQPAGAPMQQGVPPPQQQPMPPPQGAPQPAAGQTVVGDAPSAQWQGQALPAQVAPNAPGMWISQQFQQQQQPSAPGPQQ